MHSRAAWKEREKMSSSMNQFRSGTDSSKKQFCSGEADRLSPLPDHILDHILSFIRDTEEKARTSLLSKRFRHLWLHHPSIRLGSTIRLMCLDDRDPRSAAAISRYVSSVDACLSSLRSPLLQTLDLRLCSAIPECRRSVARLIRSAADRSVRNLRLEKLSRPAKLPRTVYSCHTLTSLHLDCNFNYVPHDFTGFPFLADLEIMSPPISDQTLTRFLSKCPSLRSLSLDGCGLKVLHLSSKTLCKVIIKTCPLLESVILDIPNLVSISYDGKVDVLRLKNALCLIDADITTTIFLNQPILLDTSMLITDVCHVSRSLKVDDWFFKLALPKSPSPLFRNLKELHCRTGCLSAPTLRSLVSVLRHCPKLEKLSVDLYSESRLNILMEILSFSDYPKRRVGEMAPPWKGAMHKVVEELTDDRQREVWNSSEVMEGFEDVLPCIKFVSLKYFLGTVNEMKMIEYLFGSVKAMEKVTIDDCLMRNTEELNDLLAHIPRVSSHVEIHANRR